MGGRGVGTKRGNHEQLLAHKIRVGLDFGLCLSMIRGGSRRMELRLMRTSLEDLRPVEARLLVRVGTAVHGDAVLAGRHAVARHLLAAHVARVLLLAHDRSHVPPVRVAVIKSTHAARTRELTLVTTHVVHAVLDGDNAKGVDNVLAAHVAQAVEVVQVAAVLHRGLLLGLLVLLDVSLGVGQVAGAGGVATADGALLEVTLEDVASRKGVAAEHTHVGAVASVYTKPSQ